VVLVTYALDPAQFQAFLLAGGLVLMMLVALFIVMVLR